MKASKIYERFENKRTATEDDLLLYEQIGEDQFGIKINDHLVPLDSFNERDELDANEKEKAYKSPPFWDLETNQFSCDNLLPNVDNRNYQTPIKNQLNRGTCVCFASLACLEAIAKRKGLDLDLSEQFANWSYMDFENRDQCDSGLRTTSSAKYLKRRGVCVENLLPYEDQQTVNRNCSFVPSSPVQTNATFGIKDYSIIDKIGYYGPSIANTDYLECILSQGYDIVIGTHVAWGRPDTNGVHDVILDIYGNPLASRGGHAMLMVGYDRTELEPYFILKNSWGSADGINGYRYLSYDYIRKYIKYGYIVKEVNFDMSNE
ncbi:MAG: C1 family peptidase [Balneolaceae bacterium]